jgi:NAD+ kinase
MVGTERSVFGAAEGSFTVGIVRHPTRAVGESVETIKRWARTHDTRVLGRVVDRRLAEHDIALVSDAAFTEQVDGVVSLGGDGTMLEAMRLVAGRPVPVLGVDYGTLGFLIEVAPSNVSDALERLVEGRYEVDPYDALRVRCRPEAAGDADPGTVIAFNDVVLARRVGSGGVAIDFEVGGLPYAYCRCDALVVATPTGSTAYSYAAGGPVVSSSARVTVITPVAPMAGISRSLVFPAESELSIHLHAEQDEAALELDGRLHGFIQAGDTITVESVRDAGQVVRFEPGTFASQRAVKLSLLDLPVRGDDVEELLRWELLRRAEVLRRAAASPAEPRGASTPPQPDA